MGLFEFIRKFDYERLPGNPSRQRGPKYHLISQFPCTDNILTMEQLSNSDRALGHTEVF